MAKIVAADDDPHMQHVIKKVLDRAGYDVTVCHDGGALVEEARARHPNAVVTDNEMPVMTGLEAIDALHDDPETTDIPAVLATGSVTTSEAAQVLRDGDQLVIKPFTSQQLRDAVETAIHADTEA